MIESQGIFDLEGNMGVYDIINNKIYYDIRLDKYPLLKGEMLLHEERHAAHKYNFFYHMYIDLIDLGVIFRKDFFDYYFLGKDKKPIPNKVFGMLMAYQIFNFFRGLISLPLFCISGIIFGVYNFYNNLKEKRLVKNESKPNI